MCLRRFLLAIFVLTLLFVGGALAVYQFGGMFLARQAAPSGHFEAPPAQTGPDYIQTQNWLSLPDTVPAGPGDWVPGTVSTPPAARPAAVFYIHPTTYLQKDRWNAPLGDRESQNRATLFVRSQASAFNRVGQIYAPKYRQAAFGAFLLRGQDAEQALGLAYSDVARAFDRFLTQVPDGPIILVGHSQGALHLTRLLRDRVAGKPVASRIVAAYVGGWPVSVAADLPSMGLAACERPDQARCVFSWQSYAEPANTQLVTQVYDGSAGFNGKLRRQDDMLCVNPLTGSRDGAAPGSANLGTLVPNAALTDATLQPGVVGAHCDKGFLFLDGEIPPMGPYVLPGNNYHVYDYALFWANLRGDAQRRLAAWQRG